MQDLKTLTLPLSVPAWLNAEAESKGVNFSGLLQEALVQFLEIDHRP